MLFSATLSHRVLELAYEHMNNPELVRIEPDKMTVDRVRQLIYFPSMEEKMPLLIGLLRQMRRRAHDGVREHQARGGAARGVPRAPTASTPRRCRATCRRKSACRFLREFHNGELAVLIAHRRRLARPAHSGCAATSFNYDLPQDAADYVHRIGRTARAGAEGDAISFACEDYAVSLPEIEDYIGHKIPSLPIGQELAGTPVTPGAHSEYSHRRGRPGNGDELLDVDLASMLGRHRQAGAAATIAVAPLVSHLGVVDLDDDLVAGFREGPRLPYWVNIGCYVLDDEALERLPERGDHEDSTFPELAAEKALRAWRHEGTWITVNTPKDLRRAEEFFAAHRSGGRVAHRRRIGGCRT